VGLGIKTALRRRFGAPYVDLEYTEARAYTALLKLPGGATLPLPDGAQDGALDVAVVVPFFARGSGGHTTIANLVRGLERRGHRCSLWIEDLEGRIPNGATDGPRQLREWFGPFNAPVHYGFADWRGADVVVATGWQTVARVRTLAAAGRAYLVQDHEPEFYATSSRRTWAAASYRQGLHPITAGAWLADVMRDEYGLDATPFDLGINGARYTPDPAVARRPDVVLAYARRTTPRRGVAVALSALAELHARRGDRVEIRLFGQDGDAGVDFPHVNLRVLDDGALPALYSEATVGLVLSLTNYSLVAQEMLACGLPCVELDAPSVVRAFGRDGPVDFAPLDPGALADALERLLDDPQARAARAAAGARLRAERTWDRAAGQVEAGLRAALRR
jgi:glycosyltransferase involved in cell wall biosynthesis